jgi:acylphosphatase
MSDAIAEQPSASSVRATLHVAGRVQGVGYRAFSVRVASERGVCGTVRNLDDGRVELEVEGARDRIESLIVALKQGPPAAHVVAVEAEWGVATGRFSDFRVRY